MARHIKFEVSIDEILEKYDIGLHDVKNAKKLKLLKKGRFVKVFLERFCMKPKS